MKLHTSTRLSLQFTAVATLLVVLFAIGINLFFLSMWMSNEQKTLNINASRPLPQRLFDRVAARVRSFPLDNPRMQELIQKRWHENIIKNDDEWYIYKTDGLMITLVDITPQVERQSDLARLSLIGIVLFALISYGVSTWFTHKALWDIQRLASFVNTLSVDSLDQHISLDHLPNDDEIAVLATTISTMNQKIHNQIAAIKSFVSHVSHEFKTPLMIMQSDSELALKTKKYKEWLEHNLQTVSQLNGLLESLMSLTKAEGAKLVKSPVGVAELIQKAIKQAELRYQKILQKKIVVDKGLVIKADHNALASIIYNIIDNAYKYTPGKGKLNIVADNKSLVISDTGKGIAEKEVEKIRDEFWQADDSRGRDTWFGLGLSLVKKLVELHGRRIKVTSEKGKGTDVILYRNTL